MAVTISQSPDDYSISGNPLIFVFTSTQTAQANFSFKVEVYVDAVLKETHFLVPEQSTYAHFDASDLAERYAYTPNPSMTSQVEDAENYFDLKVKVIENYGTPPADQASAETTKTVFKGKQKKLDFINFDPTDYVYASGKLWLTTFPRTVKRYIDLSTDNRYFFITDGNTLRFFVYLYQENGTPVASASTANVVRDNISMAEVNTTQLLALGFTQNNIDTADYMKIYWYDGINNSEEMQLWIDRRDCVESSAKQLLFLSRIGSLEDYRFTKRSTPSTKISGVEFQEQFGYFDGSNAWDFQQGGVTDYVKMLDDRLRVTTDWVNEDEYRWLCTNLLESPLVYINENGTYIKSKVLNSNWKDKTNANDMVFKLEVDLLYDRDTSTVV